MTIGTAYTRTYTFTRTSGGGGSTTYNLSLVGNDGTFSLGGVTSIALPKNQPKTLAVHDQPDGVRAPLGDPQPRRSGQPGHRVPDVEHRGRGPRLRRTRLLAHHHRLGRSQPGAELLLRGARQYTGLQGRLLRPERDARDRPGAVHPVPPVRRQHRRATTAFSCYSPPVPGGTCAGGGPLSRTTSNPQAGVWEITVEARRTADIRSRRSA